VDPLALARWGLSHNPQGSSVGKGKPILTGTSAGGCRGRWGGRSQYFCFAIQGKESDQERVRGFLLIASERSIVDHQISMPTTTKRENPARVRNFKRVAPEKVGPWNVVSPSFLAREGAGHHGRSGCVLMLYVWVTIRGCPQADKGMSL